MAQDFLKKAEEELAGLSGKQEAGLGLAAAAVAAAAGVAGYEV